MRIAFTPTSVGRKGKVKLATWGGGGKPHQRSRVLPQKEMICPRKELRLPLLEFSERKLDETYRQIRLNGSCLIAKRLE